MGRKTAENENGPGGKPCPRRERLDLAERWKGLDAELLPVNSTDIKILGMLLGNSRERYSGIASALGVAEATVRRRVRALVDKGIILGFTTRINFGAVENAVKAFVHLQVAPDRLNDVIREVSRHPRVAAVHRVTGPRNLILVALFVSIAELQDFVDDFLRMDGISDTEVQIVMGSHKDEHWGGA